MTTPIYKVCSEAEWLQAKRAGRYEGSADDRRDGYIHLSTAAQLPGTLARHFPGRADLVLIAFDPTRLADRLRWEPARNGSLFPHHYGPLDPSSALAEITLPLAGDGRHALPKDLA